MSHSSQRLGSGGSAPAQSDGLLKKGKIGLKDLSVPEMVSVRGQVAHCPPAQGALPAGGRLSIGLVGPGKAGGARQRLVPSHLFRSASLCPSLNLLIFHYECFRF